MKYKLYKKLLYSKCLIWMIGMKFQFIILLFLLFFFSPEKERDIINMLHMNDFTYPICIDQNNR